MLARSPLVLEIVSTVLSFFRNDFSRVCQESMDPNFSEVNQVNTLSDNVLEKILHSIASSLVTKHMVDL